MSLAASYPVGLLCDSLQLPRSSFYYQPAKAAEDEAELRQRLLQVAGAWPTYGYRRLSMQLRREGLALNSKRVRRLMTELGLAAKPPLRKCRTTNSQHGFVRYPNLVEGLSIERPQQVWVADITYVRLGREFVYLAVLMDVFTRSIRGWQLGRSLDGELTLVALRRALAGGCPQIHHSDQGVQYAAQRYVQLLEQYGVAVSMAEVGEPRQNGYAERLMRTIKEEEVALSEYESYAEAYQQIGRFLEEVYMHKRIHSALGYLTPVEFEGQWLAQQARENNTHFQT